MWSCAHKPGEDSLHRHQMDKIGMFYQSWQVVTPELYSNQTELLQHILMINANLSKVWLPWVIVWRPNYAEFTKCVCRPCACLCKLHDACPVSNLQTDSEELLKWGVEDNHEMFSVFIRSTPGCITETISTIQQQDWKQKIIFKTKKDKKSKCSNTWLTIMVRKCYVYFILHYTWRWILISEKLLK